MPIVLKSGSLNLLEPSGLAQACNGIALPLPYLPYCLTDLGEIGTEDLHAVPIISLEFRENRCSLRDALLKGVNEILPHIFCVIHSIWIKFDMRDAYLLSNTQFRKKST